MRRLIAVLPLSLLLVPAVAHGAAVQTDRTCYLQTDKTNVTVSGNGFTPGRPYGVSLDGTALTDETFGPTLAINPVDSMDKAIQLTNATKYTPRGGAVRVELERAGDRHLVRVSDDGTGIPPEAQSRVFDRFFRADEARTRPSHHYTAAGLTEERMA